jgi:hypothetical protein
MKKINIRNRIFILDIIGLFVISNNASAENTGDADVRAVMLIIILFIIIASIVMGGSRNEEDDDDYYY